MPPLRQPSRLGLHRLVTSDSHISQATARSQPRHGSTARASPERTPDRVTPRCKGAPCGHQRTNGDCGSEGGTHGTSAQPGTSGLCLLSAPRAVEFHTPPPRLAANPKMTFVQEKKEKP